MGKRKTNTDTKKHYVDKAELVKEVAKSQSLHKVTDELADMFILMVDGVAYRFGNLGYYGIREDVKQDCLLLLIQKYKNFDLTRNSSCFAYITTIIYNQIRYQLTKNKRYIERSEKINTSIREYINKHERGY